MSESNVLEATANNVNVEKNSNKGVGESVNVHAIQCCPQYPESVSLIYNMMDGVVLPNCLGSAFPQFSRKFM